MSNQKTEDAKAVSSNGLLQPVVEEAKLERAQETYKYTIEETKRQGKIWSKHKEEYQKLKSVLSKLNDKTHHKTMVPLGSKAYMEGNLVHTNEIMVLLGDNWFAERSTAQASEICDRRISKCDEKITKLNDELKLLQVILVKKFCLGNCIVIIRQRNIFSCD